MPRFTPSKPTGQGAILVLAALEERGRISKKEQTVSHIKNKGWFAYKEEDREPYPKQGSVEPRWITLLAFGRNACVERGWMSGRGETDEWGITNEGVQILDKVREKFKSGELKIRRFHLWSPIFKRRMCPAYEQGVDDWDGPSERYRDSLPTDII